MLTLRKLESTEEYLVYAYYPEGKAEKPGRVRVFFSGKAEVLEVSEADFANRYAMHAIAKVKEFLRLKIPPLTSGVSWY